MTSIKYAHLQVMGTITVKFHQNPLKTLGVAETRLSLRMDGQTDGQTQNYSPLRLTSGDKKRNTQTSTQTNLHLICFMIFISIFKV